MKDNGDCLVKSRICQALHLVEPSQSVLDRVNGGISPGHSGGFDGLGVPLLGADRLCPPRKGRPRRTTWSSGAVADTDNRHCLDTDPKGDEGRETSLHRTAVASAASFRGGFAPRQDSPVRAGHSRLPAAVRRRRRHSVSGRHRRPFAVPLQLDRVAAGDQFLRLDASRSRHAADSPGRDDVQDHLRRQRQGGRDRFGDLSGDNRAARAASASAVVAAGHPGFPRSVGRRRQHRVSGGVGRPRALLLQPDGFACRALVLVVDAARERNVADGPDRHDVPDHLLGEGRGRRDRFLGVHGGRDGAIAASTVASAAGAVPTTGASTSTTTSASNSTSTASAGTTATAAFPPTADQRRSGCEDGRQRL